MTLAVKVALNPIQPTKFSNKFSTLSNDNILGRSKLEAIAEGFKLRHQTVFCHNRMENIFEKKENSA